MFCEIVPRGGNRGYLGRKRKGKGPQFNKGRKYWVKQSNTTAMFKRKGWSAAL